MEDAKKQYFPLVGICAAGREFVKGLDDFFGESRDVVEWVANGKDALKSGAILAVDVAGYVAVGVAVGYYGAKFL